MTRSCLPWGIFLLAFTAGQGGAEGAPRAGSWNQFRGPNGSGVASGSKPPVHLEAGCLVWKVPLPPGLSSPVLSRDRIFLTAVADGRLVTIAMDKASGTVVWQRATPALRIEKVHEANSPATPSTYIADERVYAYFGSYGLLCYDRDGREQWSRPLPPPQSLYGMATSPIGFADALILVLDNDSNLPDSRLSQSRIVAVSKASGEMLWETPRPFHRSGWSTPMIWTHREGVDLVVLGSGRVSGYDPTTGAEKWFVSGFSRETIAIPVAGNGHLFASSARLGGVADDQVDPAPFWKAVMRFDTNGDSRIERGEMTGHFTFPLRPELPLEHPGYGIPLPDDQARRAQRLDGMFASVDKDKDGYWTRAEFAANMLLMSGKPKLIAIRPGGSGEVTDSHVSWELNQGIPEIPSPVFYEGRIYLVRNGGFLSAVNVTNAEILYRERLGGSGQYSASPVVANDHLYLASNRGLLSVVKAGDTFNLVHQHDLEEPVFVTPAIGARTLYVRSETNLWAFRNTADAAGSSEPTAPEPVPNSGSQRGP